MLISLINDLVPAFVAGTETFGRMPSYGFDSHGRFTIVTCEPRDLSRSSNGGDYRFWREYSPRQGKAQDACSCDFWQPGGTTFRFRPMSRREFVRHVRVARKLAVRLYRRGVRANSRGWGLFIPSAEPGRTRVTLMPNL